MKYILRYLLAMILATAASGAMAMKSTGTNRAALSANYAVGVNSEDTFTANTIEGVEMKFRVIDADARICEVATNAIDDATPGEITIPQEANGYTVKYIGEEAFDGCMEITSVIIPKTVVSIGDAAFYWCRSLTSVTIPNSVTSIGVQAFSWDDALASIHIPSSVTSIGELAFIGCRGVETVVVDEENEYFSSEDNVLFDKAKTMILFCATSMQGPYTVPNTVTTIIEGAFVYCAGITSITIPSSVTSIGDEVFLLCSGITTIVVDEDNEYYSSEDNVLFDKAKTTLLYCVPTKQGSYIVPNTVTELFDEAFVYCTGLSSIILPNSLTIIGRFVFFGCSGLTSIIIPTSVTSIGEYAFEDCSNLQDIYSFSPVPPTCGEDAFLDVDTATARLHVPEGAREDYALADGWRDFLNILEDAEATGVPAVALDVNAPEYYDLSGRKLNSVHAGLRIMREKNGSRKQLVR